MSSPRCLRRNAASFLSSADGTHRDWEIHRSVCGTFGLREPHSTRHRISMLRLIFPSQTSSVKQNGIDAWPIRIGADVLNSIQIDHPSIAPFHAEIVSSDSGPCVVDLRSGRSTYVNGSRVQHAIIRPGTEIRFGDVCAQVEMPSIPYREEPSSRRVVNFCLLLATILCALLLFVIIRELCARGSHLESFDPPSILRPLVTLSTQKYDMVLPIVRDNLAEREAELAKAETKFAESSKPKPPSLVSHPLKRLGWEGAVQFYPDSAKKVRDEAKEHSDKARQKLGETLALIATSHRTAICWINIGLCVVHVILCLTICVALVRIWLRWLLCGGAFRFVRV